MKASELIESLAAMIQKLGDVPVVVETWDNRSVERIVRGLGCIILIAEPD